MAETCFKLYKMYLNKYTVFGVKEGKEGQMDEKMKNPR
jgi:hypothetical protein